MNEVKKNYILSAEKAMMKLQRMAYELLENNGNEKELILAGISGNGTVIASLMANLLKSITHIKVTQINVVLEKKHPKDVAIEPVIGLNHKVIILIDDVINSGKTLTFALKPFLDANPSKIQTLVLVERSHTKFPVQANYVGLSLSSFLHEHIVVEVEDGAVLGAYVS
jgi:pyrimidine operon attenuation protein/uracil phosphoribosyltransferase